MHPGLAQRIIVRLEEDDVWLGGSLSEVAGEGCGSLGEGWGGL